MFLRVVGSRLPLAVKHVKAVHEDKDMLDLLINEFFAYTAFLNKFLKRLGHEIVIIIRSNRHLNIKSRLGSLDRIMYRTPVGNYKAVITPFITDNIVQIMCMLRSEFSVYPVI